MTRTWTNAPSTSLSTLIQSTNSIANARTNLKVQLDTYKFTNGHTVAYGTGTADVVYFARTNEPISIAIAGLWASVRYVTNTVFASDYLFVPPKASQSNNFLTWQWSALATNLAKSTSAIVNVGLRNVWASNMVATNFSAPGTGANSTQIGDQAIASGDNTVVLGNQAEGDADFAVALGQFSLADGIESLAVGYSATAHGAGSIAIGQISLAASNKSIAIGDTAQSSYIHSAAIGADSASTKSNQVRLGTSTETVSIPGNLDVILTGTLARVYGTNADFATAVIHTGQLTGTVVTATSSADLTGVTARSGNYTGTVMRATTLIGSTITTFGSGIIGNDLTVSNEFLVGSDATMNGAVTIARTLTANSNAVLHDVTAGSVTGTTIYQNGPGTTAEGTYTSLTGGSNNVVQLSTNKWTRLSGHTSGCNVNSLRFADGYAANGREAGIINDGSYAVTLIDRTLDGFETLATNRMDLGGANIVIPPRTRALFRHRAANFWEILFPTPGTNATTVLTNAVLTAGSFTNTTPAAETVVMFPNGAARTNWLNSGLATIGSKVTVLDWNATASGTNIYIFATSGNVYPVGPSNVINSDMGAMTFLWNSTNWYRVGKN